MLSGAESCFLFPVKVKVHSKDELHQLDELKQTQRAHLEELLEQHWNSRGDAFLQPAEGYSLAGEEPSQHEEAVLFAPHWAHNFTQLLESKHQTEKQENAEVSDDVGAEVKRKLGGNGNVGNKDTQTASPLWEEDASKISKSHTGGLSKHVTENLDEMFIPSKETLIERGRSRFRPTKEPNPDPREQDRRSQNETPELELMLQVEEEKLEAERKELLLLHKRLDQEKEILRLQKIKQEEEGRLKEKETDNQQHLRTTTPKSGKKKYTK